MFPDVELNAISQSDDPTIRVPYKVGESSNPLSGKLSIQHEFQELVAWEKD